MKSLYNVLQNAKNFFCFLGISASIMQANAQKVSTFENLPLDPESYWDGSDLSGGFANGDAYFYNNYNKTYKSATGFSYSNITDVTTPGVVNQFSAYAGEGALRSENYAIAIAYGPVGIKLTGAAAGSVQRGFFVTNATYAALSMKEGDDFGKKFGGSTGNDADWFKLTITGYLNKTALSNPIDFYLSDFRFSDNNQDYIVDSWKWVDLTTLGQIDSLAFTLSSSDVGMWGMNTPGYFAIDNFNDPLFAPAANMQGTSAMHKDSSAFIGWARGCTVDRGPQDISNISLGNATVGEASMATGQPGGGVVSLGDGGSATLNFSSSIANGTGPDFAVFENGFSTPGGPFLELAFVEVSSDGSKFVRFPSASFTDVTIQKTNADGMEAKKIHNLAGKYVVNFGTPFDLEDLKDSSGLDLNAITYVRIVDVVGSINSIYARYDSYGNKINDPWTTAFTQGGFDLDAVGVIHTSVSTGVEMANFGNQLNVYPNPIARDQDFIVNIGLTSAEEIPVQIFDHSGMLVKEGAADSKSVRMNSQDLKPGMYIIKVSSADKVLTQKLIIN